MNRLLYAGITLCLMAGLNVAAPRPKANVYSGEISDSMCGLKHMMSGTAKDCTDKCVGGGSKYVLADVAHGKVYQLSNQEKPKQFSGEKVNVTGTLKDDTIEVQSIEAAK